MQIFFPYQRNPKCRSKMWNYLRFKSQVINSSLFRNRNWINEDMFGMSSRIDVKLHSHKRHKVYYTELRFRSTRSQKTQVAVTEQMNKCWLSSRTQRISRFTEEKDGQNVTFFEQSLQFYNVISIKGDFLWKKSKVRNERGNVE